MTPIRVAIVCDFAEEQWPSMDLVAAMLLEFLARDHRGRIEAHAIRPRFVRRFTRAGNFASPMFNADRFINRFIDYPIALRSVRDCFDLFHIIDHSYSHLVHELPAGRAVLTCHDLDTFRCVLDPARERRSEPFRAMVRRIMDGFRKAERVCCVSETNCRCLPDASLFGPPLVEALACGTGAREPSSVSAHSTENLFDFPFLRSG